MNLIYVNNNQFQLNTENTSYVMHNEKGVLCHKSLEKSSMARCGTGHQPTIHLQTPLKYRLKLHPNSQTTTYNPIDRFLLFNIFQKLQHGLSVLNFYAIKLFSFLLFQLSYF